ncbi:hypothetical protein BO83DRAFT_462294 [Aspergillus eucalypticola CBS 122712]|uniref:TNT domain-containing protein n=1 Tax=Aspergillus eucalypticola (strain CBS 122712 / IBT 29274) TaxID=1448314 RepID=A0A317VU55_ASPEC|nr:uncharacterized protein BO83DRAFT_462294 [Aspergillus eucalypticola CBS 122712]PWY76557.1 hypothetical protein BO83DRAFT_462294 [Aspergillus eucalypticola CBS 122712]
MFIDWVPLGGLCPRDWLCTWANWTDNGFNKNLSNLVYGPNDGFDGCSETVTLEVGTLVDRFGGENGSFLAPANASYGSRSIGPSSLVKKYDDSPMYNYWLVNVTKPFEAQAGYTLPWDGQPGNGWAWYVKGTIAPLLEGGYIERIDPPSLGIIDEAWEVSEPLNGDIGLQD